MTIDVKAINDAIKSRKRKPGAPVPPSAEKSEIEKEAGRGIDSIVGPYPTLDEINKKCGARGKRPRQLARTMKFVNTRAKEVYLRGKRARNAEAIRKLSVG